MTPRRTGLILLLIAAIFSGAVGCTPRASSKDKVILTVNGDRITDADIRRELALRQAQDPSFKITPALLAQQVEIIIDRRLMIQEAMRRKLAEQDAFVHTIRNFWEQTLIRDLLIQLNKELAAPVTVSENEINGYYDKLSQKAVFEVARRAKKQDLEALADHLKHGEQIAWDETLGPVDYEQVASPVLDDAFSLGPGEFKTYSENGVHYLIRLVSKEPAAPPALSAIRDKIEARIKRRKQEAAVAEWLKTRRSQAKIELLAKPAGPAQKK